MPDENYVRYTRLFNFYRALGLDRLGLAQPEQAIYRMVRKGILKPRKIGRFLAFSKTELDHIVTNGEKRRTPGRPRKIEK